MIRWMWIIVTVGIEEAWRRKRLCEFQTTWRMLKLRPWRKRA